MQLYHYHPETGVYVGESVADENPKRPGDYLLPAFSTTIAPPAVNSGERAHWNGAWLVEPIPEEEPETPPVIDGNPEALLAYATFIKNTKEYGGITVSGVPVPTDEKTLTRLTAARVSVNIDPNYSVPDWKIASGVYTSLTAAQIVAMSDAAKAHVQNCYTVNKSVDLAILATPPTITTAAEIDAAFNAINTAY